MEIAAGEADGSIALHDVVQLPQHIIGHSAQAFLAPIAAHKEKSQDIVLGQKIIADAWWRPFSGTESPRILRNRKRSGYITGRILLQ